jgi:hypothetical protein
MFALWVIGMVAPFVLLFGGALLIVVWDLIVGH